MARKLCGRERQKVETRIGLFSGLAQSYGKLENPAALASAEIRATQKFRDFLTNNLSEQNAPSQALAIMALAAKSDGMITRSEQI